MIVDVLAVVDCSALDLADGGIDLRGGLVFPSADGRIARTVLKHPARGAQVGQRVQVGRMLPRQVSMGGRCQRDSKGQQQADHYRPDSDSHEFFSVQY